MTTPMTPAITRLYDTVFDRAPDAGGLQFWEMASAHGATLQQMAGQFVTAPEFAATYGQPTDAAFVEAMYRNVLDRAGEGEGVSFWTATLGQGLASRADIVVAFSESAEHVQQMAAASAAQPAEAAPMTFSGTYRGDHFTGGDGNDTALGFEGDDTLEGGAGNDVLAGFDGNDYLVGGPGDDLFVFDASRGSDTIADFQRGDHIRVDAGRPVASWFIATGNGGPLVLDVDGAHGGWNTVYFQGLTVADEGWVREAFIFA